MHALKRCICHNVMLVLILQVIVNNISYDIETFLVKSKLVVLELVYLVWASLNTLLQGLFLLEYLVESEEMLNSSVVAHCKMNVH